MRCIGLASISILVNIPGLGDGLATGSATRIFCDASISDLVRCDLSTYSQDPGLRIERREVVEVSGADK